MLPKTWQLFLLIAHVKWERKLFPIIAPAIKIQLLSSISSPEKPTYYYTAGEHEAEIQKRPALSLVTSDCGVRCVVFILE